jgi:tetratricopeptide (TPR) repeat protein
MTLRVALVLLALCLFSVTTWAAPQPAKRTVSKPVSAKHAAAHRPATHMTPAQVAAYNQGIVQGNRSIALLKQGITQGQQDQKAAAIKTLEQSNQMATPLLGRFPQLKLNVGQAWALIGQHAMDLGQTDKAVVAYQKALAYVPATGDTRAIRGQVCANLGRIYMLQNKLSLAKPLMQEAVTLGHDDQASLQAYVADITAVAAAPAADHFLEDAQSGSGQSPTAQAPYELWDPSHRQLNVYLHPGPANYTEEVIKAFAEWQQKLKGLFTFTYVNQPELADCEVIWTEKPDPTFGTHHANQYASGYNGKTRINDRVTSNNIYLSKTTLTGTTPFTEDMYNTTLHEIGHLLGVHHSPSPGDVMVAVSPTSHVRRQLTPRDVNTVIALYSKPPTTHVTYTPANIRLVQFKRYHELLDKGGNLVRQKQLAEGQQLIEEALALYPDYPLAPVMLSDVYIRQGNNAKAKQILTPWANSAGFYASHVQCNFVVAQINETFALANKGHWNLAQPRAQKALQNVQVVLRQTDLDADMRAFLTKAQLSLNDMANYKANTAITYGDVATSSTTEASQPAGKKKHWWQGSDYTNQAPVYIPMPSRW